MKRRHAFTPSAGDALESRVVLSHGHVTRGLSVVVSGLSPRQQVLNARQQPVVAEVNQAFASFQSDYGQARSTYFASILNQAPGTSAVSGSVAAFTLYTTQRVELLAEQLISSFLQYVPGTSRVIGHPSTLKQLVLSKIVNPQPRSGAPTGLLLQSLINTIPPAGASPSTESLYTLSQNNAIEAAQVTVINAVNITKNGDFGNTYSTPHPQ